MSVSQIKDTIGTDFLIIGLPVIIVIGCVGNFLSFLVYSRKFFEKKTLSLYLKVLSVSDTVAILIYICSTLTRGLGINVKNASVFSCKFIWYMYYVPTACSSWIEAAVCFDRMINIVAPSKYNVIKQKKFIYCAIGIIIALNLAVYVPTLVFYDGPELVNNRTKCDASESFILALGWYDFFNSTAAPFLIMLVSTFVTVRKLNESRKNITNLQLRSSNESINREQKIKREQRDMHFAVTSILLCVLFFVLNVGISTYYLITNYSYLSYIDDKLYYSICVCLMTSDYAIKFYIYLAVNRHFRNEFKGMLNDLIDSVLSIFRVKKKA